MKKLDFYDVQAVKDFMLDVLIENRLLEQELEETKIQEENWFNSYIELEKQNNSAEERVKELENKMDKLNQLVAKYTEEAGGTDNENHE